MSYCFTLSPRLDRVMKLFISLDASSLELLSFFLTEFVSVTLFKTLSFSVLLFVVLFESFPINLFFFFYFSLVSFTFNIILVFPMKIHCFSNP